MKRKKEINIDLKAPRSWAELSEDQVIYVADILSTVENLTAEELALRCLLKFTALFPYQLSISNYKLRSIEKMGFNPKGLYRYKRHIIKIDDDVLFAFAETLKFLAEPPGLMICPAIISGLHFNDSQLYETTFEEYCMADKYYRAYSKSQDDKHLCTMIAVLYRKKGESYRDEMVETNTHRVQRGSKPAVRQAVFLWWTGVKLWIKTKYPDLFGANSNTIEFGNTDNFDEDDSILNMVYSITEGKAHENKQVYKTPVHEVLHALNVKAKQINEMNKKK
jgi:hypothetical protein